MPKTIKLTALIMALAFLTGCASLSCEPWDECSNVQLGITP